MDEGKDFDPPIGRPRLIKRPRLTSLLDDSKARVILLVAPAGYGKTTLAREWLSDGQRLVSRYTPSARGDAVAFAIGILNAVERILPGAADTMRHRLAVSRNPEQELAALAESLAGELSAWPPLAWLVVDDYQMVSGATAAGTLTEILISSTPINLLVASRTRPEWATARRVLYGDILELNRSELELTADETSEILDGATPSSHLLAVARGWPAVVGLAARSRSEAVSAVRSPQELYDYFAEELFAAADPRTRSNLVLVAIAPVLSRGLLERVLGANHATFLAVGSALGFVTELGETVEMHPLLRSFLLKKLDSVTATSRAEAALQIFVHYLDTEDWDYAFDVLNELLDYSRLDALFERALYPLLDAGRVRTLGEWVDAAVHQGATFPLLNLAHAELAFRRGSYESAQVWATRAAELLGRRHPLCARAYFRAGQSAHLSDRATEAIGLYELSRACAEDDRDTRQALWGRFTTESELGHIHDSERTLKEMRSLPAPLIEDELQLATARLSTAMRIGGIVEEVEAARSVLPLIDSPADPVARASFLHMFVGNLSLCASYLEALGLTEREITEANRYGLSFVLPHAYIDRAVALTGLRAFRKADLALRDAEKAAAGHAEAHSKISISTIRARILAAQGLLLEAHRVLASTDLERVSPGMYGEFLATRGLIEASLGETNTALKYLGSAVEACNQVECTVLCGAVRAAIDLVAKPSALAAAPGALDAALGTGNYDGFIAVARVFPALVAASASGVRRRAKLAIMLSASNDHALARGAGLEPAREQRVMGDILLSAREHDVLALLGKGLSNRQIAECLWISESTAKVHVRHIFEKLGVRSRTEAALHAARSES